MYSTLKIAQNKLSTVFMWCDLVGWGGVLGLGKGCQLFLVSGGRGVNEVSEGVMVNGA